MNNERTKVETSNEKVQTVYKDQIPRGPEAIATDKDGYVYVSCRESNVICDNVLPGFIGQRSINCIAGTESRVTTAFLPPGMIAMSQGSPNNKQSCIWSPVRTIEIDQVGFIWYLHPGP
jgi:hypothetical protein